MGTVDDGVPGWSYVPEDMAEVVDEGRLGPPSVRPDMRSLSSFFRVAVNLCESSGRVPFSPDLSISRSTEPDFFLDDFFLERTGTSSSELMRFPELLSLSSSSVFLSCLGTCRLFLMTFRSLDETDLDFLLELSLTFDFTVFFRAVASFLSNSLSLSDIVLSLSLLSSVSL